MNIIKQSTQVNVHIGPVVAVGDGFTPVTTLSLSTADEAEILKAGATTTTDISAATMTAITGCDGYYYLTLTTSHTDTCGTLTVAINDDSLCLPVRATFQVVEESIYDALFAASAAGFDSNGRVDLGLWLGSAPAALADTDKVQVSLQHGATGVITSTLIAADAIGASELATDAVNEIRNAITGGAYALDTDANGAIRIVDGTGARELDTNLGLIAGIAGTKNTLDDLNDPTAATIADSVWDENVSGHISISTFGYWMSRIVEVEADTQDLQNSAAAIEADTQNIQGRLPAALVGDRIDATVDATGMESGALDAIADAVWDEVITGAAHNVNASAAKFLREGSQSQVLVSGTAQGPGTGNNQIQLASGAVSINNIFNGARISILEGTGEGQSRLIKASVASTDTLTLEHDWTVNPDATSIYAIMGAEVDIRQVAESSVTFSGVAPVEFDAATSVWEAANLDHATASTMGLLLNNAATQSQISALNDLDAAGVRAAVGLASANLDTQFAALPTQSEITGGAYALDTDANGRMRIVDGTAAGELDTNAGLIAGIAGTKNTLDDLNDPSVSDIWTTQLTESYAANGAAPTGAQALFALHQRMMQFAIASTTMTVRKLDNSTPAFLATLDDASSPTSLVRV